MELVELENGLAVLLLFVGGVTTLLLALGEVSPPLEAVDVGGVWGEDEVLELLGERGIDEGELGLGGVDGLVVGAGAEDIEDRAGLGVVKDGVGHGGDDFGVGQVGHLMEEA